MKEPATLPTDKSLDQGGLNPVRGCYLSLVDINAYVYADSHEFYSSVTGVMCPQQLITNPTVNGRVFDGDDVVFTNVTTALGPSIGAVVIARQNSGGAGTWRLVMYEDTGITGIPLIPSGGNILVTWNTQGIFGL